MTRLIDQPVRNRISTTILSFVVVATLLAATVASAIAIHSVLREDREGNATGAGIHAPATEAPSVGPLLLRVGVANLGVALVLAALARRMTRKVLEPIQELSVAAARISRGEMGTVVRVPPGENEIALLAGTFNDMIGRLKQNHEQIETQNRELTLRNEDLQRANEVLAQLSITDGLTKLHNHRYFQDLLVRESRRSERTRAPLSLLLIDIDDFKKLNDQHGHATGDQVLEGISAVMNATVRETDQLARYGGEEFVVLSIHTDLQGAIVLGEKVRMAVEAERFPVPGCAEPLRVSVSVGVAQAGLGEDHQEVFRAADRALYRAKASGKNCVVADRSDEGPPLPA